MTFQLHLCGFCVVSWNRILLKSPVLIPEQGGDQSSHYGLQYSVLIHFHAGFYPLFTKMQLGGARITHSPPNHDWRRVVASLKFFNFFMGFPRAWSMYPVILTIGALQWWRFSHLWRGYFGIHCWRTAVAGIYILAPSPSSTVGWGNVWYFDNKL